MLTRCLKSNPLLSSQYGYMVYPIPALVLASRRQQYIYTHPHLQESIYRRRGMRNECNGNYRQDEVSRKCYNAKSVAELQQPQLTALTFISVKNGFLISKHYAWSARNKESVWLISIGYLIIENIFCYHKQIYQKVEAQQFFPRTKIHHFN